MPKRIYYLIKSGKVEVRYAGNQHTPASSLEHRFWDRVDVDGPLCSNFKLGCCWMWKGPKDRGGYGILMDNKATLKAHRYSWILYNGPIQNGICVLHKCDNAGCVNPNHLFIGTHKENQLDKIRKGRQAKGEKNGASVFTTEMVLAIRRRYKPRSAKDGINAMAREFNVSPSTICSIVNQKTWKTT